MGGAFASLFAAQAHARGRQAVGGRLSFRIPWSIGSCDPHRIDDPFAALFGEALFDTLYATNEAGAIVPSLAEKEPEPIRNGLRITLRGGLRSARGRPITTTDVARSIARARANGAKAWLADIPPPIVDPLGISFTYGDAGRLARAFASPLVAIVPDGFSDAAPDGTGPFRFSTRGDAVVLLRNPLAARGPAFLEEIVIRAAPDRSSSLASFEKGADDLGWLEGGLRTRPDSTDFDLGVVGWSVLHVGQAAQGWDGPGVAQQICDEIPPSRLASFKLGPSWTAADGQGWGGPPAAILVREDAPYLVELAQSIAALVSRPAHEITVRPTPASEIAQRKTSRSYALLLDVVRFLAPGGFGASVALATADNPSRAEALVLHPPKLGNVPARTLTRTMRLGVVGEIRVLGGRMPATSLAASPNGGFDLGASTHRR